MEHNAEYRMMMRAKRKKERTRKLLVNIAIIACGAIAALLGVSLLFLRSGIKKQHELAVEDYNRNNWQTVEDIPGGKKIAGSIDGVPYEYVDDGTYYEGISIDGIDISGMSYAEAREALVDHVTEELAKINMTLQVDKACMVLSASDLNVKVNVNELLQKAYDLGRVSEYDYSANYLAQQELKNNPVNFDIEYSYDRESIAKRVASIAEFVNTNPKEPYVTVSQRPSANTESGSSSNDGPVVHSDDAVVETVKAKNGVSIGYIVFNPGTNGFTLDEESMVDDVALAFENGEYDKQLTAELHETEPSLTIDDLRENVKLLSSYQTEFESSNLNRRRNIQKAAAILNACTVAPWQEISFNEYVGPRTEKDGWLRAPGITGGKEYQDSPGGGICQVTGTLYNALLACGQNRIKITVRQHHSWPSSYVPIGLDATVDTGGPDLCWRNVSDSGIYIFTYADVTPGSRIMYVYIYGKPQDDGSYYKTHAELLEEIEPDPVEVVYNPSWPSGYSKTTVTARKGYKADAYLIKYNAAGEEVDRIYLYTDLYVPVRGQITKGSGPASLPIPGS